MKRIFLIAFLSFQLLTHPATAQIAPNEAMKYGKPAISTPPKMQTMETMENRGGKAEKHGVLFPNGSKKDNKYDAYNKRIIEFETLVKKQNELIEKLKYELNKCKEAKNGK